MQRAALVVTVLWLAGCDTAAKRTAQLQALTDRCTALQAEATALKDGACACLVKEAVVGVASAQLDAWAQPSSAAAFTEALVRQKPRCLEDELGLAPVSHFTSEPPGAQVFVDGALRGVTPLDTALAAGRRNVIRFELEGYFREIAEREPNARERFEVHARLREAARLEVKTTPPGASVSVELEPVLAASPGLTSLLEPGDAWVVVHAPGHQPIARAMTLPPGVTPLELTLSPGVPVNLRSTPAGAEVRVDGVRLGRTPLEVAVAPGSKHVVELRKEGWGTVTKTWARVTTPQTLDVKLVDLGLTAATKEAARARKAYDLANDALERMQEKLETAPSSQLPALEKKRQPLDAAMEKAAERLEKAEAALKAAREERGLPPEEKSERD